MIVSLTLAVLSFAIFLKMMAYPWQLAVLAATAIGALVYSIQSTWRRMRRLYRPPDASDLAIRRDPDRSGRTRPQPPKEAESLPARRKIDSP